MPETFINSDQQIFYLDENCKSAVNVLLLHGLGANSGSWLLQVPALIDAGFRVIAPDSPGFGRSPYDNKGLAISRSASLIVNFLDCLDITSTHIIGISMGGVQALQIALDYPQYVNRLVLVNTFANMGLTDLRTLPYLLARAFVIYTSGLDRQAHMVANRVFPNQEQNQLREELIAQINEADISAYRASIRALSRFNVKNRLGEINSPTLVITGKNDTTVQPNNQNSLVDGIPGAIQVVLNTGHAASVEAPHQFNEILIKFLQGRAITQPEL